MRPSALLLLAIALAPLSAQTTVVSPAGFADVAAPHSLAYPFGLSTADLRFLSVHDDLAGPPRGILGFALRRAGGNHDNALPISLTLDCVMSTATTTAATVSEHFATNHGLDWVQVIRNRTFSIPGTRTGRLLNPFAYQIPLDGPFLFGGRGPLCWDAVVSGQYAPGATAFDAVWGAEANPLVASSVYGDGCRGTGQTWQFKVAGGSQVDWTADKASCSPQRCTRAPTSRSRASSGPVPRASGPSPCRSRSRAPAAPTPAGSIATCSPRHRA